MKKIISFIMLCLCVVGVIGGIGYSLYCGAWPVVIGVAALTYSALPEIKKYFTTLTI